MSAPAPVSDVRFPFPDALFSKDDIPFPLNVLDTYDIRGCSTYNMLDEEDKYDARHHCCWLEGVFHVLLSDPFTRYFVQEFDTRCNIGGESAGFAIRIKGVPIHLIESYSDGLYVMGILRQRFKSPKRSKHAYEEKMRTLYGKFRERLHIRDPTLQQDNAGKTSDVGEVVTFVLPGLRYFIAYNWPHSKFAKHYSAYGCTPLIRRAMTCSARDVVTCPLKGEILEQYAGKGMRDGQLDTLDWHDTPSVILLDLISGVHKLEDVIGAEMFPAKWKLGTVCHSDADRRDEAVRALLLRLLLLQRCEDLRLLLHLLSLQRHEVPHGGVRDCASAAARLRRRGCRRELRLRIELHAERVRLLLLHEQCLLLRVHLASVLLSWPAAALRRRVRSAERGGLRRRRGSASGVLSWPAVALRRRCAVCPARTAVCVWTRCVQAWPSAALRLRGLGGGRWRGGARGTEIRSKPMRGGASGWRARLSNECVCRVVRD